MVELAKAQPGKFNIASSGFGSEHHLAGELFKLLAGINLTHVPYKGFGPAAIDTIAGQVELMFGSVPAALQLIKAGKLKALAVTGSKRSPDLPDVPTFAEAGYPDLLVTSWTGLLASVRTPRPILDKITEETVKALQSAGYRSTHRKVRSWPDATRPEGDGGADRRGYPILGAGDQTGRHQAGRISAVSRRAELRDICMLILTNEDVSKLLTMDETLDALRISNREIAKFRGEAEYHLNRVRTNHYLPWEDDSEEGRHILTAGGGNNPRVVYNFKSMEGGSPHFGMWAVRSSSDLVRLTSTPYGLTHTYLRYGNLPGRQALQRSDLSLQHPRRPVRSHHPVRRSARHARRRDLRAGH